MISRKKTLTILASMALGVAAGPLMSTALAAPSATKGLTQLSLQGVGIGTLATEVSSCGTFSCAGANTCDCLTGTETLVGNQGFSGGQLIFSLLIDQTNATTDSGGLTASNLGFCFPGTGVGTIANRKQNNAITISISGLACPTAVSGGNSPILGPEVFTGTYVISPFTNPGKFNGATGVGYITGSQDGASGPSQVSITGSIQP